jgi:uncharacterized lipoprotein YajG
MIPKLSLILVLASAMVYSCASAPRPTVDLMPPPHLQLGNVGRGSEMAIVIRDARAQLSFVATHNNHTYEPSTDVVSWIRNALTEALEQSGFRVHQADSVASAPTSVVIMVMIEEVLAQSYTSASDVIHGEARVLLRAEVYDSGEVRQIRHYSGGATGMLKEDVNFGLFGERIPTGRPVNKEYAVCWPRR